MTSNEIEGLKERIAFRSRILWAVVAGIYLGIMYLSCQTPARIHALPRHSAVYLAFQRPRHFARRIQPKMLLDAVFGGCHEVLS